MSKNIVVLIPALNPNEDFIDYSKKLLKSGNVSLIVVDDGSREELKYIFKEIGKLKNTTVLTHAVNLGKGRALKNGFNYYINNFNKKDYPGIITADSDGQHKECRDGKLRKHCMDHGPAFAGPFFIPSHEEEEGGKSNEEDDEHVPGCGNGILPCGLRRKHRRHYAAGRQHGGCRHKGGGNGQDRRHRPADWRLCELRHLRQAGR